MPKVKLLVVEDEEIVAFDLESTLKSLGYHVLAVVATGEEAIACVAKNKPDLVLMDIMLKGNLDGIQAAEEIKTRFNLPSVYLTAYADYETLTRAKISEPFGYLLKPFQEKDLQTTIEIALMRHQAEEKMRQALIEEKEQNRIKSEFLSIASHEFRTPLTTIGSSSGILELYERNCPDERKKKHFRQIQASVNQLKQLMDDVLLIGKADAGKLEFNPAPLDLIGFCLKLVEELQLNNDHLHHIAFNSQGECANACMDENLMRRILTNLLSNAIKYSPPGSPIMFSLTCQDEVAVFQIQDRGIGIPPEDQIKLFESFHRANNVGAIPGTGLGLSIVKKCIDLHGGWIYVDSEVGVGTTFTIMLPLCFC